MSLKKKLPIGIEFFAEFNKKDFYYVDKTGFIVDLLHNLGKVNLFTRPRRFGKSLNMDMLKTFFEIGCDCTLFNGLKVTQEKEICEEYMGQYPVVSITLKGVDGRNFEAAKEALKVMIGEKAGRFNFLRESERLTAEERARYVALISVRKDGGFAMSDAELESSLQTLSYLLSKHYSRNVIILIDEYDVPLDKAFQAGYYDEMVSLIRNLFSNALKTNDKLEFAVLTGCLRVSKESIFTGLNNLKVFSITSTSFGEYFGFTDREVKELLAYYELSSHCESIKAWYDGYRFGKAEVYCPWDVINYCFELRADETAPPEDYWSNTSSNSMVRRFIDKADQRTRDEIESLIAGETIVKEIHQELTYSDLDSSVENLWSILFTTGYLTQRGREDGKRYRLAIPNREIRELFVYQIREWFRDSSGQDAPKLDAFCEAFPAANPETIERLFNDYLWHTISIRDTAVPKERKENFYHGILLGLLAHKVNWRVISNTESGEGYSDILIEIPGSWIGVVVEMKYAEGGNLDAACREALAQINDRQYDARLRDDGMDKIVKVGIACFKKRCKVAVSNVQTFS
jgi:hypothetical protein